MNETEISHNFLWYEVILFYNFNFIAVLELKNFLFLAYQIFPLFLRNPFGHQSSYSIIQSEIDNLLLEHIHGHRLVQDLSILAHQIHYDYLHKLQKKSLCIKPFYDLVTWKAIQSLKFMCQISNLHSVLKLQKKLKRKTFLDLLAEFSPGYYRLGGTRNDLMTFRQESFSGMLLLMHVIKIH